MRFFSCSFRRMAVAIFCTLVLPGVVWADGYSGFSGVWDSHATLEQGHSTQERFFYDFGQRRWVLQLNVDGEPAGLYVRFMRHDAVLERDGDTLRMREGQNTVLLARLLRAEKDTTLRLTFEPAANHPEAVFLPREHDRHDSRFLPAEAVLGAIPAFWVTEEEGEDEAASLLFDPSAATIQFLQPEAVAEVGKEPLPILSYTLIHEYGMHAFAFRAGETVWTLSVNALAGGKTFAAVLQRGRAKTALGVWMREGK